MKYQRSIWFNNDQNQVEVIDQRKLPFIESHIALNTLDEVAFAIKDMVVRGAPLIGVTAAYGIYIAAKQKIELAQAFQTLIKTRPTAINLQWALNRQLEIAHSSALEDIEFNLLNEAHKIAEEDIKMCSQIGKNGLEIIKNIYKKTQKTVNILTHCNAGWLATVQWGTATAPIYKAHQAGIPVHVWVDETRPRNQGARLTAWELSKAGVDFHVIADNTGGHLMQHQQVDLVIVGSDRTTFTGDVCNKIGTYLKALAAHDNNIPFYAALPISTIDWKIRDGLKEIPIETRGNEEITFMNSLEDGQVKSAQIMTNETPVANYAFDVTPAKYVTGLITEKGICEASEMGLKNLYNK